MSRTHRKRKHSKITRLEQFLTSTFFRVVGILLILAGLVYLVSSSKSFDWIKTLITGLISPSEDIPMDESGGGNLLKLVGYFLPVIVGLCYSIVFAKKQSRISYYALLGSVIYLIAIQFFNIIVVFSAVTFAIVLLAVFPAMVFLANFYHKRPVILILNILFFYLAILLFALNYGWLMYFLVPAMMVFSGAVVWQARKMQHPVSVMLNFLIALGVFGLFWLRKFVINSKTDFLFDFFLYGCILYLFLYVLTVIAESSLEKMMKKWMLPSMVWLNLALFGGTAAFVVQKYYTADYLWVPVVALLAINLAGVLLIRKYAPAVRQSPYLINAIVLVTLLFPLILGENKLLLFMAVLSVALMYYASFSGERVYIIASFAAMGLMLANYLYHWGLYYVPALILSKTLPEPLIIIHGAVGGLAASAAFATNRWLLDRNVQSSGPKWFSRHKLLRVIRAMLLFTLFTAITWIVTTTSVHAVLSIEVAPIAGFISGALFFIIAMQMQAGTKTVFRKPVRYLAIMFGFLYPMLVQQTLAGLREGMPGEVRLYQQAYLLHLVALALLIGMGNMAIPRLYRNFIKTTYIRRGLQVLIVVYLLFLLPTEYDSLTVYAGASRGTLQSATALDDLISGNLHLPYSILLGLVSLATLAWATLKHHRFMRRFSIGLLLLVLIKIFAFDFAVLSIESRTIVLIVIGVLLIAISAVYPKVVRRVAEDLKDETRNAKREMP